MKTMGVLLCSLILVVCARPQQKAPSDLQPLIDQLDKAATDLVKEPQLGSFTMGLVQKTGLVWAKSYGYADIERQIPAATNSIYRVGSVTKQFTAIMFLQLAHDGKVHLSDPVEKYYPEIHLAQNEYKNASPVTLLQLATHTSGQDSEPDDMWKYMKGPLADWEKTLISAVSHTKFVYEPGSNFLYSNVGYAILGVALSRAAHQPYIDYVKEKILLPLGMTHSDFVATPEIRAKLAKGYDLRKDSTFDIETPITEQAGRGYKVPNGGLYSTLGDLARFEVFEMLGGPESVLPHKELEDNTARVTVTDQGFNRGYGIGFIVERRSGHVFVGHAGGTDGYIAVAFFQPEAQTGIVILRNQTMGFADRQPRPDPNLEKLYQLFVNHWK